MGEREVDAPPQTAAGIQPVLGKYSNLFARFFGKITYFRAVATRCDKDPDNVRVSVKLAAVRVSRQGLCGQI